MPAIPSPRVLIESLVRADGTVPLAEAYAVANAVGIEDQPLRLAIRRLVAEGEFVQEGRGRAGVLQRTAEAGVRDAHEADYLLLAYGLDAGEIGWDGRWHLLGLSIPERERALRDRVRRGLVRLGAGQLQPGLYVSPHAWEDYLLAEFPELRDRSGVALLRADAIRIGALSEPVEVARSIWDLGALAARHAALLEGARLAAPAGEPTDRLAAALRLAHLFDAAHREDPLLPPDALPADWIGARARAAFAVSWRALTRDLGTEQRLFARFDVFGGR